ncbi:MAG: hypothetical protein IT368_01140, partial [Candidatus Hydrogenedentes bacterium]|nr:hypothetical protein [Candidatus Hydrogenedentota bacterium]
ALAFLEDVERARTEALAAESKRMGKRSPEFKEDWSRFTEKPKDRPDGEKEERTEMQEGDNLVKGQADASD